MKRFAGDIKFMLNVSVGIYWKFCWVFFIPVSLTAILVYFIYSYQPLTYEGNDYPPAAICELQ